jgi:hypothetical protein
MREWWQDWCYEWRDWRESGIWKISMPALVCVALIVGGAIWAPAWIKSAAFNVISVAMGLGAAAFMALMAWGVWDMIRQDRRGMRQIRKELSEGGNLAAPPHAARDKNASRQNVRSKF